MERGDQIIEINNQKVTNREQAIEIVQNNLTIILKIVRFKKKNISTTENDSGIILTSNNQSLHQVRLLIYFHFNYIFFSFLF